ncbi:MAG: 20S proteasome subunit A/B [Armatimonadetes bacterium]|nr:20S proteasome subunit A/B [Armatimonadota bacterium]
MVYTPYDWNQNLRHRNEYVEDRLRDGSPVVAISFDEGILLLTIRKTQRKVFELYDRLMFSAVGNQADIEAIRIAAIDFAHQEGFIRSPDDVTIQRLVGFAISPAIKNLYSDQFRTPLVLRALFAELGHAPEEDLYYTLNYDGEFLSSYRFGVVGGSEKAEERMVERLQKDGMPSLEDAMRAALKAWADGRRTAMHSDLEDDADLSPEEIEAKLSDFLKEALKAGQVEAAILERNSSRESKFRLLGASELEPHLAAYRG